MIRPPIRNIIRSPIRGSGELPILATALVDHVSSGIQDNGVNVTGWLNSGTGGSLYDLDTVLGVNDMIKETQLGRQVVHAHNGSALSCSNTPNIPRPVTIFAVFQVDNIIRAQYIFDGNGGAGRVNFFYGPALSGYRYNGGATYDVITIDQGPLVVGMRVDGASGRAELGGLDNLDPAAIGVNSYDYGHLLVNEAGTDYAEAWVGRRLVFDSALSTTDFDDVMTFLRSDWGGI